jgi:hypothetical protein
MPGLRRNPSWANRGARWSNTPPIMITNDGKVAPTATAMNAPGVARFKSEKTRAGRRARHGLAAIDDVGLPTTRRTRSMGVV